MGFALPFAGGTPHVGPPVKLSASVPAKTFCGCWKGPPANVPARLPPTSVSGTTSVPCELPLAFGDHLTTSETGVVVGSLEMLVSAEQVTSSVVVRCAT
jgi:hypothetical protein